MADPREMISLKMAGGRITFRTVAIAVRDRHVLVHRAHWDEHWSLPGGRVERGEASAVALAREVEEELGVSAKVGPLRFVMESFFVDREERFHEIGFYYEVGLPGTFPFREDGGICHTCEDGGTRLEFKWVKADADTLEALNFYPVRLRELLGGTADGLVHIMEDEAGR